MRWYLNRHADRLFANRSEGSTSNEPVATGSRQARFDRASDGQVSGLARRLEAAERPVLIVGSQALVDASRVDELAAAVGSLGVPTYLTGMARGLLGAGHPSQRRHARKPALREADCLLLAGVPNDFRLEYGNHLSRQATLLSVNRSAEDLKKNRRPTLGVLADPLDALVRLAGRARIDVARIAPWLEDDEPARGGARARNRRPRRRPPRRPA